MEPFFNVACILSLMLLMLKKNVLSPGGGIQHITYGEVSPIFLGQDIVKSDIFGSKEN